MPPSKDHTKNDGSDKPSNRARVVAEYQRTQSRQRRRGRLIIAGCAVAAVAIVAGAVVVVGLGSHASSSAATTVAATSVVQDVATVPAATFDAVGVGAAQTFPTRITAPALTADGLPRVLYVGAEYCPYCAAERWAVVAALSRFGTFSGLGQTTSAHADVFPDTATLSFHGSTYTSTYLSFTGVEETSNQPLAGGAGYQPLDTLSAPDSAVEQTYNTSGSIPFIDLGGSFVSSGATFSPQVLAGRTHAEIAAALADPGSDIARSVDGAANVLTAALCTMTDQQPTTVCSSPGVTAGATKLPAS